MGDNHCRLGGFYISLRNRCLGKLGGLSFASDSYTVTDPPAHMNGRDKRPEKRDLELSDKTREVASFAIMYAILGLIFYVFVRYYPTHSAAVGLLRPW